METYIFSKISSLNKAKIVNSLITRTAWAVFKYCGTKTVPLKKYEKIDF